jgi:hypothetical protein
LTYLQQTLNQLGKITTMKQIQYALLLSVSFLLCPTTTFSMLSRAYRQRSEQRIKTDVGSIQNVDEVNRRIELMKENASKECIQEFVLVTQLPYETATTRMTRFRSFVKEALKHPKPDAFHDPAIPTPLYTTMCANMRDEEVNPQSIDLFYDTNSQNPLLFADARDTLLTNNSFKLDPSIQFYPSLSQISQEGQAFRCRHMLWRILLDHNYMNYAAETCNPTANQKRLHSAQTKEADIYAAAKNISIARAGAVVRCTDNHIAIINHDSHCAQMQTLYALMMRKEELS